MAACRSIRAVTESGSRLEQLKSLASLLAAELDGFSAKPAEIASLARQYRETINQIAAIEADDDEGDAIDEIVKRRADRQS